MIKELAITTITLITLSACSGSWNGTEKFVPNPFLLKSLPQGNDSFSQGFRDGCYNFIGQMGYGIMRFHNVPVQVGYIYDNLYRQGYEHGDRHCSVFVNKGTIL